MTHSVPSLRSSDLVPFSLLELESHGHAIFGVDCKDTGLCSQTARISAQICLQQVGHAAHAMRQCARHHPRLLANVEGLFSLSANSEECRRSEEHTSELQSLMRISYAVFCLKKKNKQKTLTH